MAAENVPTPPWDLVNCCGNEYMRAPVNSPEEADALRPLWEWGYQQGADAELDACCDAIYLHEGQPSSGGTAEWLRTSRRPKPPSLKKQALEILKHPIGDGFVHLVGDSDRQVLLQALESLPDDITT